MNQPPNQPTKLVQLQATGLFGMLKALPNFPSGFLRQGISNGIPFPLHNIAVSNSLSTSAVSLDLLDLDVPF